MTLLTTRRPIGNLFNLHNEMGRIFGDLLGSNDVETNTESSTWMPTVDITETDYGYEVRAELPGVSKDNVSISVKDNLLTITGEKHQNSDETKNYRRKENRFGSFERSFYLPPKVEPDSINAEFSNGVLTLSIPKPEEIKPKVIQIETDSSGE